MRAAVVIAIILSLSGCTGGEFNHTAIDVDRLPITDDGDFFLGRTIEW
ncbi:MAG: hypothetical protein QNJ13_02200 [Paracoccaceae bacterium]|nr:hypothetical protein [Paracoccaceae bacterium]